MLGQGGGARGSTALPLHLNAQLGCVPHTLGRFDSAGENTYSRLQEAWAGALIPVDDANGLAYTPANAKYHLSQDDLAEKRQQALAILVKRHMA